MTRIRVCCVVNFTHEWHEFLARMKKISCTNEASKLKIFKRPTSREQRDLFASGVNAPLEKAIFTPHTPECSLDEGAGRQLLEWVV